MKRNLAMAFALLFVFAFVFSLAATVTGNVKAEPPSPYRCLACCYKPPTTNCTAEWGQVITGKGCLCTAAVCYPTKCTFQCKSCS